MVINKNFNRHLVKSALIISSSVCACKNDTPIQPVPQKTTDTPHDETEPSENDSNSDNSSTKDYLNTLNLNQGTLIEQNEHINTEGNNLNLGGKVKKISTLKNEFIQKNNELKSLGMIGKLNLVDELAYKVNFVVQDLADATLYNNHYEKYNLLLVKLQNLEIEISTLEPEYKKSYEGYTILSPLSVELMDKVRSKLTQIQQEEAGKQAEIQEKQIQLLSTLQEQVSLYQNIIEILDRPEHKTWFTKLNGKHTYNQENLDKAKSHNSNIDSAKICYTEIQKLEEEIYKLNPKYEKVYNGELTLDPISQDLINKIHRELETKVRLIKKLKEVLKREESEYQDIIDSLNSTENQNWIIGLSEENHIYAQDDVKKVELYNESIKNALNQYTKLKNLEHEILNRDAKYLHKYNAEFSLICISNDIINKIKEKQKKDEKPAEQNNEKKDPENRNQPEITEEQNYGEQPGGAKPVEEQSIEEEKKETLRKLLTEFSETKNKYNEINVYWNHKRNKSKITHLQKVEKRTYSQEDLALVNKYNQDLTDRTTLYEQMEILWNKIYNIDSKECPEKLSTKPTSKHVSEEIITQIKASINQNEKEPGNKELIIDNKPVQSPEDQILKPNKTQRNLEKFNNEHPPLSKEELLKKKNNNFELKEPSLIKILIEKDLKEEEIEKLHITFEVENLERHHLKYTSVRDSIKNDLKRAKNIVNLNYYKEDVITFAENFNNNIDKQRLLYDKLIKTEKNIKKLLANNYKSSLTIEPLIIVDKIKLDQNKVNKQKNDDKEKKPVVNPKWGKNEQPPSVLDPAHIKNEETQAEQGKDKEQETSKKELKGNDLNELKKNLEQMKNNLTSAAGLLNRSKANKATGKNELQKNKDKYLQLRNELDQKEKYLNNMYSNVPTINFGKANIQIANADEIVGYKNKSIFY